MSKKKLAFLIGTPAIIIALYGIVQVTSNMAPSTLPSDYQQLSKVSYEILDNKCAACHIDTTPAPFYASFPIISGMIKDHIDNGLAHWNITGNSPENPLSMSQLNKLDSVLKYNSMPIAVYSTFHWSSNLSSSERQLLTTWVNESRMNDLAKWHIKQFGDLYIQPLPTSIPTDAAKVALGDALYHDKRLSKDNSISCASCHSLEKGGTDNEPFSPGVGGQLGGVNAPTTFNAVFNIHQFWDGRAGDLQAQAGGPPLNPVEMASADWKEIISKLEKDADFTAKFVAVYPEGYSEKTICDAIAEYEKTLITPNSRFDQFLKGNKDALSALETKGYELFIEKNCALCHSGPSMGGQSYESINLKADYFSKREAPLSDGDNGRYSVTQKPSDKHKFKVPTLRNVELTAPYYHDASKPSLEKAIESMLVQTVGDRSVSPEEVKAITAFLKTLTGELHGKPLSPSVTTKAE